MFPYLRQERRAPAAAFEHDAVDITAQLRQRGRFVGGSDPLVRGEQGTRATGWREALGALLERLEAGAIQVVVSPKLSNEDLGAVRALVDSVGGGEIVYRSERAPDEVPLKGFPKLVRRRELAPNVNGAQLLGMKRVGNDDGTGGLEGAAAHDACWW